MRSQDAIGLCALVFTMLTVVCHLPSAVEGGNILVLHPMFAPSHVLAIRTLAKEMVERGHSVTVVRTDKNSFPCHPNISDIVLNVDNSDGHIPMFTWSSDAKFYMPNNTWTHGLNFNFVPTEGIFAVSAHCKILLSDQETLATLRGQKFDLVLVDLLYNECGLALAHDLGAPAVGYWAFTFAGYEPMYTMGYNPPSVIPYIFSYVGKDMNFLDRIWNYFLFLNQNILYEILHRVINFRIQQYLPGSPSSKDLLANLSGVLINSHSALDYPRNLPPTFLEIGRFHIEPPKPLPNRIQKFLDSSGSDGVVVFSLGCTFNIHSLPIHVIENYLGAFSRLPMKVIMRIEGDLPFIPENVMVVKWMPQSDILAHPKTKLFVTHCGMHGVMEAIHYGVPMVGIPVFGDQMDILQRLQDKEAVVGVSKDADEDTLYEAFREALTNKTYTKNLQYLRRVMLHQTPDPLGNAVWLLEHVMMTKGADHLKIRTRFLNRFQRNSLDVIAFYLLSFGLIFYVSLKALNSVRDSKTASKLKS